MPLKSASANRKDVRTASNGIAMEHRHFAFIAKALSEIEALGDSEAAYRNSVILHFAEELAKTNPKFDRKRFLAACDIENN